MIHSRLLGRDFETEEEKKEAEDAFKARMKNSSSSEQSMAKGVQAKSQSGFQKLRSMFGSN